MVSVQVVNNVVEIVPSPVVIEIEPIIKEVTINTSPIYLPVDENPVAVFIPVLTGGEENFELPSLPILVHRSLLFVNGVQQSYGVDYVINGIILSWLGFPLESSDYFELRYNE